MEPPLTTIRVGPRIEFYGPMPLSILETIMRCLEADYPHARCTGGDVFINLLLSIELDPQRELK